jgi:hypothetical protein
MNVMESGFKLCLVALVLMSALMIGCGKKTQSKAPMTSPHIDVHTAVITGDITMVKQHIDAGSDLNAPDPNTRHSPLMNAIVFGQHKVVRLLIQNGVDLDARNNDGSTALMTAAFFAYPEMVKALLEKGADTSIRNNAGASAIVTVQAPWVQAKPIYDFVEGLLQPIGLKLDYETIQKNRPIIYELLKDHDESASIQPLVPSAPDYEVKQNVPSGDEKYLNADSDYIFDQERLHTFELNLPESALAKLDADPDRGGIRGRKSYFRR